MQKFKVVWNYLKEIQMLLAPPNSHPHHPHHPKDLIHQTLLLCPDPLSGCSIEYLHLTTSSPHAGAQGHVMLTEF